MKLKASINDKELDVVLHQICGYRVDLSVNGVNHSVVLAPQQFQTVQLAAGTNTVSTPAEVKSVAANSNEVRAPIPGVVVSIAVKPEQTVAQGATLLVLEAMKMENAIGATRSGEIEQIHVKPGEQVKNGQLLVTFKV